LIIPNSNYLNKFLITNLELSRVSNSKSSKFFGNFVELYKVPCILVSSVLYIAPVKLASFKIAELKPAPFKLAPLKSAPDKLAYSNKA
jgi:hypothetical protein